MAWMPGALRVPISTKNYTRTITKKNILLLHIAVTEAASLRGWFENPSANASSHFYIRRDGTIEQYIDTDHMSWANGSANPRSITCESQGMANGQWTTAQCKSFVAIAVFAHKYHGIKLQAMRNSKTSSVGVGYHMLGVAASAAQKRAGISQTGGQLWSSSVGKICPGPDRIPQIPGIIAEASGTKVIPTITPKPKPTVKVTHPKHSKDDTKRIQSILAGFKMYRGEIDGLYGPVTHEAVEYYQKHQLFGGLYADGEWGAKTEAHYQWVKLLQSTMNQWRGTDLLADGDYGKVTANRVTDIMNRNKGGLYKGIVDGIPGPVFCKMLGIKVHP